MPPTERTHTSPLVKMHPVVSLIFVTESSAII